MRLKKVKVLSYNEYKERKEYQNKSQRYNGWSNYSTWLCNLYLDNSHIEEITEEYETGSIEYLDALEEIRAEITEQVEGWSYSENIAGVQNDLLSAAISDINISELAEASLA